MAMLHAASLYSPHLNSIQLYTIAQVMLVLILIFFPFERFVESVNFFSFFAVVLFFIAFFIAFFIIAFFFITKHSTFFTQCLVLG